MPHNPIVASKLTSPHLHIGNLRLMGSILYSLIEDNTFFDLTYSRDDHLIAPRENRDFFHL